MFRLRPRRPPSGFIAPCLPSRADKPLVGPDWIHEIKHDGYRLMARRDAAGLRLLSRNGIDLSDRFPLIAAAVTRLPVRSCLIDGEAVVCDRDGLAVFDALRFRHGPAHLVAFDLIELDGRDLRHEPLEVRKRALTRLIGAGTPGLALTRSVGQCAITSGDDGVGGANGDDRAGRANGVAHTHSDASVGRPRSHARRAPDEPPPRSYARRAPDEPPQSHAR